MRFALFALCLFAPAFAQAETYECSGFEPSFTLSLSNKEIVLTAAGESADVTQHLAPVQVVRGNKPELRVYRVSRAGEPDFVAVLDGGSGICESERDGIFTHRVYYSSGPQGVADGCCVRK